jgi:hypothetical protein
MKTYFIEVTDKSKNIVEAIRIYYGTATVGEITTTGWLVEITPKSGNSNRKQTHKMNGNSIMSADGKAKFIGVLKKPFLETKKGDEFEIQKGSQVFNAIVTDIQGTEDPKTATGQRVVVPINKNVKSQAPSPHQIEQELELIRKAGTMIP